MCIRDRGYRDQKYLYFGRFSARLDDVANFIPARITGVALLFAAWLTGRNARRALSTMRREMCIRDRTIHLLIKAKLFYIICSEDNRRMMQ